jgi:hypothetical protein
MSFNYTYEKLDAAIYNLVTSPDEIKSRLYRAWLQMHTLNTESHNLTQSMRDKFDWIETKISLSTISGVKLDVQASIDEMSSSDASETAKYIFALYREILSVYEKSASC